ncbi:MAG: fumarylacetoacetate hydrolase family protein [Candidatus Omnitrophica bacterium]|nr:fumarylacetoacetate hydrolase family protein [Candidatus Omnitrophota bacterium]
MRIVRFSYKKRVYFGIQEKEKLRLLKSPPFEKIKPGRNLVPLSAVKILTPTEPSKIVLVGLNYRDHALELKMLVPQEPVIFLKPPTASLAHNGSIIYPAGVGQLDYEAELAIVIRKTAGNIVPARVKDYILGYTCLNDVTARDLQKKDIQWTRAKSFDTFCPFGPWVETDLEPNKARIVSRLNGVVKQDSNTSNFIFPVESLVSFVSSVMTLFPGDVISTGTPPGVGPMQPGDTVEVEIEGIGILKNPVKSA